MLRLVRGKFHDGDEPEDCFPIIMEGSILVFMPGVMEIMKLTRLLEEACDDRNLQKIQTFALHGTLSSDAQAQVFSLTKRGVVRVIVATNIAEASVTIPGVVCVIDACKVKQMIYDEERQMPYLVQKMASKDSLRQRKGRAGRVQAGWCFRLIHERVFESLPQHSTPEILCTPIESLVLQVLSMENNVSDPTAIQRSKKNLFDVAMSVVRGSLRRCPDPPSELQLEQAVRRLQILQAIPSSGENEQLQLLTPLGKHISNFPCPPIVGKLLLYGAILGCISPISGIAACMTLGRDLFEKRDSDIKRKFRHACSANSDHMLVAEVLLQFRAFRDSEKGRLKRFCSDSGLIFDRVQEVCKLQEDLLKELVTTGFLQSVKCGLCVKRDEAAFSPSANGNSGNVRVLRSFVF